MGDRSLDSPPAAPSPHVLLILLPLTPDVIKKLQDVGRWGPLCNQGYRSSHLRDFGCVHGAIDKTWHHQPSSPWNLGYLFLDVLEAHDLFKSIRIRFALHKLLLKDGLKSRHGGAAEKGDLQILTTGIDISAQRSKDSREFLGLEFDYVITLCDNAREACPYFPAKTRVMHHGFDDPPKLAAEAKDEEEAMDQYRRVRDEIKTFVEDLPHILMKA